MKQPSLQTLEQTIQILLQQKSLYTNTALMDVQEHYKNPFHVLISCILSLRTKDAVTALASQRLFALGDTPRKIVQLAVGDIMDAIYPVGFYKTKARTIQKICTLLLEKYSGNVPQRYEELLQFPGVGPKTAAIVMVYGHDVHEHIPTDSHVHQIANRLGWVQTKKPEETEHALKKIIPKHYWRDLNDLLVQFGQNICVPLSPWCSKCPVVSYCLKIGVKRSR